SFMSARGSSLRKRQTSTSRSRRTTATSSPRWLSVERMASGCVSRRRSIKAWATGPLSSLASPKRAAASRPLAAQEPLLSLSVVRQLRSLLHGVHLMALRLDLLLQDPEPVEDLLRAGRAAGDVHVHRDDPIGALHGGVVVVEAAGGGADAERHHPLRLG